MSVTSADTFQFLLEKKRKKNNPKQQPKQYIVQTAWVPLVPEENLGVLFLSMT